MSTRKHLESNNIHPADLRAASTSLLRTVDHQPVSRQATLAEALYRRFTSSECGSDSIELWLDIAAEAERLITAKVPEEPCAVTIFAVYDRKRTNAVLDPRTGAVYITSGPLTGMYYPTAAEAAQAVVTCATGVDDATASENQTSWRLPASATTTVGRRTTTGLAGEEA